MKIGLELGGRGITPPPQSLRWARNCGARAVELWTVDNDFDPRYITHSSVLELLHVLDHLALACPALRADWEGFDDTDRVDESVTRTLATLDLALQIGATVVTGTLAPVSEYRGGKGYHHLVEALQTIGAHAAEHELVFCANGADQTPEVMRGLLVDVGSPSVQLTYDPAGLFMAGVDPVSAAQSLHDAIGHIHVRDAVVEADEEGNRNVREVAVGQGQTPLRECMACIAENDYEGFFIAIREQVPSRTQDLMAAMRYLHPRQRLSAG